MNCIISLFNENITNNNCVFLYERNRNIEFNKIGNFWFGSIVKDNEYITKNCDDGTIKVKIEIPMGILKIPISNNCTYSGRNFILPYFESSYFPKKKNYTK